MQTRISIIAYHEAGHAVAAIVLRRPFKTVDIVGDEEYDGLIIYKATPKKFRKMDRSDARIIQRVERNAVVTFAGGIAQRRYAPRSHWHRDMGQRYELAPILYYDAQQYQNDLRRGPQRISRPSVGSDLQRIDDGLAYIGQHVGLAGKHGEVARAYRASLRARAEKLVEDHWPEIQKVAKALLKQKTLHKDEVRRAMFLSRSLREAERPQSKQRGKAQ